MKKKSKDARAANSARNVQPTKTAKGGTRSIHSAPESWRLYIGVTVLVFAAMIVAHMGGYMAEKTGGLIGAAVVAAMFTIGADRMRRLMTPLGFAVLAYMLLAGASTLYARAGKFAIAEFSCMLIAFAVFAGIVLYARESDRAFRRVAGVLAAAAAPVGVLSIDAASCNILMHPFRTVLLFLDSAHDPATGTAFYARLNTILGNPNTYAGLMSIACLLSLWLALTAENRRSRILCGVLLTINAVSYLLAFSMGSLGIFVLAVLLMLALCPGERRVSLLLLLFQTAVVALAVAAVSVRGFGDTVTGSPLPMLALAGGCAVFCLLEEYVRGRVAAALEGRGQTLLIAAAALAALVVGYLIAGLTVTGAFTFGQENDVMRTADLPAGEYTLSVRASAPLHVRVAYKNTGNLIQNNDTELAVGTTDAPISFTVPEDSRLTFITFAGGAPGDVIESASYTGAAEGSLKLGYKLLPNFIADRIQDLSANGNVVQRGVYRQDAIRLWKTAPVFGRGLGGFENGVVSVQDYYYETKHAHNHYVEVLCNLGVLGLLSYLALLGTAVWSLLVSRKTKPLMVTVLGACVLQMFGQAVTDLTWSSGSCMVMFFGVLAMITLYCGDTLRVGAPKKSGAVRIPVIVVSLAFVVLIGLNLIAQFKLYSADLTIDDLKTGASIDLFEKNDYKLSYLLSGGSEAGVADKYAADLQKAESNAIAIPLAQYYITIGQYDAALDTLEHGAAYMRADEQVWQQLFDLYETMLDPVGNMDALPLLGQPDRYTARMKAGYDKLCAVNAQQLDNVNLTARNNTFLGKLIKVYALSGEELNTQLAVFSGMVADTAYAPDVNADGAPDYATTLAGEVTWHGDGSFTAVTDSVVVLDLTVKNEGDYVLSVTASDLAGVSAAIDGEAVPLDAAGRSQPIEEWGGGSDTVITITVPAGVTASHIGYAKG